LCYRLEDAREDTREVERELEEFQENSQQLEKELETQLEQADKTIRELRTHNNRLQLDSDTLKVDFIIAVIFYSVFAGF
jgi:TolA-binding protein